MNKMLDLSNEYILCDIDGVVCDNMTPMLHKLVARFPELEKQFDEINAWENWKTSETYYIEDWLQNRIRGFDFSHIWEWYRDSWGFYENLLPNKKMKELLCPAHLKGRLHFISRTIYHDDGTPGIVTDSKVRWIERNFPNATYEIVHCQDKKVNTLWKHNFKDGTNCINFTTYIEDRDKEILEFLDQYPDRRYVVVDYGHNRTLLNLNNITRIKL